MKIKLAAEEVKKKGSCLKKLQKACHPESLFIPKAYSNSMCRASTTNQGWAPQVKGKGTNGAVCAGLATCQDLFQNTALRL